MGRGQEYITAALLGAAALTPDPAAAQDGGLTGTLSLTPGFLYEDNQSSAQLGFSAGLQAQTKNQRFSLSLNGAIDSADRAGSGLNEPRLNLSYGIENRNTAIDTSLSYRRTDIDSLFLEEDLGQEILVLDEGQREDLSVRAALSFGREAPFGGTLNLSHRQLNYLDTTDPSLLDEQTQSADLSLRFEIDRRLTATLEAQVTETDEDGLLGVDQRRESLTVGLDMEVNPALTTSVSMGPSRITDTVGGIDTVQQGFSYALSAVQALPNGSLSGRIDSSITSAGRLTSIRFGRQLDLPRGALRFGAGLTRDSSTETRPLVSVVWQQETPSSTFGLTLDSALEISRDGERAVNNRLRLSWAKELDSLSSVSASLTVRDTDRLDPGTVDTRQASLSLSWSRDLTQDWALRTSYTHSWTREDGRPDDSDNSVFLGLERSFQWRR